MADGVKIGTDWTDAELDAIVHDYFAMLDAELAGREYVKLQHSRALMAEIGRSHRSVEFKHQNISAVLEELGLPRIKGYKPKKNYQGAIFGAIDRYLSRCPDILQRVPDQSQQIGSPDSVFVPAPSQNRGGKPLPTGLYHLLRKFDPVERDFHNRRLGKAGEEFVLGLERQRLVIADRGDLARKIRWVSAEDGDGAGYDILSFDRSGRPRLIEVKTTNGPAQTPFYLTRVERDVSSERPSEWQIYRVHLFARNPRIFQITPPLDLALRLRPETWRASF